MHKHTGKHKTISGDAFNELERLIKNRERFDVVVIDPPSFAKSQKEIVLALKKYRLLAQLGVKLTSRGGMLVLASCSSRISSAAFFRSNEKVLEESNRSYTTFLKTGHDVDHPVSFAEGAYLKCGYYKFES